MNIIRYSKTGDFSKQISKPCENIIIAIDSQLISTHQAGLPKMSNSKASKAIPFALESELLDDIDSLAFFPKKSSKLNQWDVFVISSNILDALTEKLQQSQCNNAIVLPDFMLLPFDEKITTYIEYEEMITYRNGKFQGGCIAKDIFHQLFDHSSQLTSSDIAYNPTNSINLLAGNIQSDLMKYLQPWKIPTAVALITIALSTTQIIINNHHLEEQLNIQKSNNEQQFRALFPNIKNIVNMRVQTKQRLSTATKQKSVYNNGFLTELSKQSDSNIQASKVTFNNQKLTIQTLK